MNDSISTGSAAYLDILYEEFLRDPNSVPEEWLDFFQELGPTPPFSISGPPLHSKVQAEFLELGRNKYRATTTTPEAVAAVDSVLYYME